MSTFLISSIVTFLLSVGVLSTVIKSKNTVSGFIVVITIVLFVSTLVAFFN